VIRLLSVARNTRGVALVEFAVCLPFFLMLMTGGIELGNMILMHVRLERTSRALADMVARKASDLEGLSDREMNDMILITRKGSGEDLDKDSRIVVTSVLGEDADGNGVSDGNVIKWQRFGGSYVEAPIALGCWSTTSKAVLAKDRQLNVGETLYHVQITKKYDPLMRVLFEAISVPTSVTRAATFRGRGSIFRQMLTSPGVVVQNRCTTSYTA